MDLRGIHARYNSLVTLHNGYNYLSLHLQTIWAWPWQITELNPMPILNVLSRLKLRPLTNFPGQLQAQQNRFTNLWARSP